MTAVGNYKLFNILPLRKIYTTSRGVGQIFNGSSPH
jgi:hypothetical protein